MASTGFNPGSGAAAASSSSANAPSTTPSTGTQPPALPITFKVSFTLNTTDGLRKISFGLEKDTDGVTVNWTITFVLYERTNPANAFGDPIVSLNVFVASTLHAKAETAAQNGLTPAQTAHATGPAANAARAAHAGTLPQSAANRIIENTLQ